MDRCQYVTPRRTAAAATDPETSRWGRPRLSCPTTASVHNRPGGPPSALATASLAAKQPVRERAGRPISLSANRRVASCGVLASACSSLATSAMSTPIPTIMRQACHEDRLASGSNRPDARSAPTRRAFGTHSAPRSPADLRTRTNRSRSVIRKSFCRRRSNNLPDKPLQAAQARRGRRGRALTQVPDRVGKLLCEAFGLAGVFGLDHDADRWLGTARPDQHPAGLAKLSFGPGYRLS